MKKFWLSFNGQQIELSSIIEKSRDAIEKIGIDPDKIEGYEALFVAAQATGKTVPELCGF